MDVSNNTTTTEYDLDEYVDLFLYPAMDHVIIPVIWPIIIIVGLIGNSATVVVLLRVPQMKTPLNVYLVSLAFSDSVFLAVAPIPFFRSYAENDLHDSFHQGNFSPYVCKIIVFLIDSSFQISNVMILCVSAERYLAICRPFKYRENGTRSRAFKISTAVWLTVFAYQSRLLFSVSTQTHTFPWPDGYRGLPSETTWCHYCGPENDLACKIVIHTYVADIGVGLLIIVGMVPMYVLMVMELRKSPFNESKNIENRIKAERKIFRTVTVTVSIYAMCFLPYRLLNLFIQYYNDFDQYKFTNVANLTRTPMFMNAAINPIIYTLTNKTYRDAFCWYFNPCGCDVSVKGSRKRVDNNLKVVSQAVSSTATAASVVSEQC
ncbi:neuromedin-U receptor 2-like [Antedon mediterranea]|uniref:neuromedin-U receptor 2-like n=1 Tax=Antedon mediterranea TaxID=105859 RepID=UPI003AF934CE